MYIDNLTDAVHALKKIRNNKNGYITLRRISRIKTGFGVSVHRCNNFLSLQSFLNFHTKSRNIQVSDEIESWFNDFWYPYLLKIVFHDDRNKIRFDKFLDILNKIIKATYQSSSKM